MIPRNVEDGGGNMIPRPRPVVGHRVQADRGTRRTRPIAVTDGSRRRLLDEMLTTLKKTNRIMSRLVELEKRASNPPSAAEFLLTMLATTRRADAMIGDLNEGFTRERREFDRARAVRLYWARTLRSLGPLVWRAIGKVVVAAMKRFFGLSGA
jgi:hypothetical protein